MKKMLFVIAILTSSIFAQGGSKLDTQVPQEVRDLIHNAINGTENSSLSDFNEWKVRMGFDSSTRVSDLKAGEPIKYYWLIGDSIARATEKTPISALVVPIIGQYDVPLLVNGKIVAFLIYMKNKTSGYKWELAGKSSGGRFAKEWEKVIKKWPKSSGYNPIIVQVLAVGQKRFFHIPERGEYNLTYLPLQHYESDSFAIETDSLYSTLTESKDTYKSLKMELDATKHLSGGHQR
jgi:hypothetical protein